MLIYIDAQIYRQCARRDQAGYHFITTEAAGQTLSTDEP
jgi:hypothetical protein